MTPVEIHLLVFMDFFKSLPFTACEATSIWMVQNSGFKHVLFSPRKLSNFIVQRGWFNPQLEKLGWFVGFTGVTYLIYNS